MSTGANIQSVKINGPFGRVYKLSVRDPNDDEIEEFYKARFHHQGIKTIDHSFEARKAFAEKIIQAAWMKNGRGDFQPVGVTQVPTSVKQELAIEFEPKASVSLEEEKNSDGPSES